MLMSVCIAASNTRVYAPVATTRLCPICADMDLLCTIRIHVAMFKKSHIYTFSPKISKVVSERSCARWACPGCRLGKQLRAQANIKKHVLLLLYGSRHMLHAFLLIDSGSDKFGYCLEDLDALERPSYRLFQFSDLLVTTTLASLLQRHAQQLSWQPKLNPGIQRVESCIKGGARPRKPVI